MTTIVASDLLKPAACSGQSYEAEVPDTLDLAERACLGLEGIAGITDPNCYYQMWFTAVYDADKPYLAHGGSDPSCTPKLAESFPMLRTACGSQEHLDVETQQMAHLLSNVCPEDGLYYNVWKPERPWHSVYRGYYKEVPEDYAWVGGVGRMMRAMMTWRERDGEEGWDKWIEAMARGLAKIAVYRDDYAYYPDGGHSLPFCYPRSGWLTTKEPQSDVESAEGSVLDSQGHPIYALARWYLVSGDKQALELARKLSNFCTLPKMWGGLAEEISVKGSEQGHFYAHPHGHMAALRGLLEYGRAAQDDRILEFVRRSYEYLRTYMIPRIGWFPCNGVGESGWAAEACNLGDLIALGIRLTDTGLGDFWEDVDAVTRNLLMEQQLTDVKELRQIAAASNKSYPRETLPGQETTENMPDRIVGIFASFAHANCLPSSSIMGCCTGNATQGLYFAWEGALRCEDQTAQINLLVNRASRLADVDSYLPYEGKVAIHNKTARRIAVRMFSWIDRRQLRLTIAGRPQSLDWVGNYLLLEDLQGGEQIVLEFPVLESTCSYTASHRVWRREGVYSYTFRGSTVVDVTPKDSTPGNIPIYARSHLRQGLAPMKKVVRFVPDRIIQSW